MTKPQSKLSRTIQGRRNAAVEMARAIRAHGCAPEDIAAALVLSGITERLIRAVTLALPRVLEAATDAALEAPSRPAARR